MPGNWTEIHCFKKIMPIKMHRERIIKRKAKKREKEIEDTELSYYGNTQNIYFTFAVKFLTRRSWSLSLGSRPYPLVFFFKKRGRVKIQVPKNSTIHNC